MAIENQTADFDQAVNLARQSLYRFSALCLLDPRAGAWPLLRDLRDGGVLHEAASLLRSLPQARPEELALGERPLDELLPQRVLDRLPDSAKGLNAEFESAFGLLVSCASPPYESEYINNKFAFQRSNALANLNGFYHAFGLKVSDKHPERPDHIVLELEFMAHLLAMERAAWNGEPPLHHENCQVCHDAQVRFLSEHLAWWTPAFATLLCRESPSGFYSSVGTFLAALIPAERSLLGVPAPSQVVRPSAAEEPELCEGCEISR